MTYDAAKPATAVGDPMSVFQQVSRHRVYGLPLSRRIWAPLMVTEEVDASCCHHLLAGVVHAIGGMMRLSIKTLLDSAAMITAMILEVRCLL